MTKDAIPRLRYEALDPALQAFLKPTVDRLGYLGEFFQVAGHVDGAVPAFMQYTGAVKTPLADAHNEILALTVCRVPKEGFKGRPNCTHYWCHPLLR